MRITLAFVLTCATLALPTASDADGPKDKKGEVKPQTKEETLGLVIQAYRAADAKGLARVASSPVKSFIWVTEDPTDKKRTAQMKEFGEFLAKVKPVWSKAEGKEVQIAQFGPVTKAWHLHFVKKGDRWYLAEIIGGD